jgi:hypothetical protein
MSLRYIGYLRGLSLRKPRCRDWVSNSTWQMSTGLDGPDQGTAGDRQVINYGDGEIKATTWTQLADEVESDGDNACEALAELERRLPDLRMAHQCHKPLKHIP